MPDRPYIVVIAGPKAQAKPPSPAPYSAPKDGIDCMKPQTPKPKTSKQISEMIRTGKGVRAAIRRAIKQAIKPAPRA